MFVEGTVRFTQHLLIDGGRVTVSRDDSRDVLRYNWLVIKMNAFHTDFMGYGGYVNHSRI